MLGYGFWRHQQLIESVGRAGRLVREIATHRRKRNKNFVHVPTVVAGILFLLCHDADHEIRDSVEVNIFVERVSSFGEQLLGSIAPEERYAAGLALIIPVVETSGTHC